MQDLQRPCTTATQKLASGPNSGPSTIAPTIRIGVSRKIPTAAISVESVMKIRKLAVSSVDSDVSSSTSSHTTAFAGSPGAARSASSAAREMTVAGRSTAIDAALGEPELLEVGEHDARRLPGDIAQHHVPTRPARSARQVHDVRHGGRALESVEHLAHELSRDDDAKVDHGHRKI